MSKEGNYRQIQSQIETGCKSRLWGSFVPPSDIYLRNKQSQLPSISQFPQPCAVHVHSVALRRVFGNSVTRRADAGAGRVRCFRPVPLTFCNYFIQIITFQRLLRQLFSLRFKIKRVKQKVRVKLDTKHSNFDLHYYS